MSAKEYSKYQHDVIRRYYDNLDAIKLGKLQELVTELYLAQGTAREEKLWERVEKMMVQLKIKPGLIEHIMHKRSTEVLARNLNDWLKQADKK